MSDNLTIKFSELRRKCFCDSDELTNNLYIINKIPHEWVGIGMVAVPEDNSNKPRIEVIDG